MGRLEKFTQIEAKHLLWSIYETHYDACGHFLRCCRHDVVKGQDFLEFDLQSTGSRMLLLRIVPQDRSAFNALQEASPDPVRVCWKNTLGNTKIEGATKWYPIWTIQPISMDKSKLSKAKRISRIPFNVQKLRVETLRAIQYYWQEKNASGEDHVGPRELKRLGTKNLTLVSKEGAHHFNVCDKISTEELVEFLLSHNACPDSENSDKLKVGKEGALIQDNQLTQLQKAFTILKQANDDLLAQLNDLRQPKVQKK